MENNIETRIKPNFIEMLRRIFGSKSESEAQKDVSEMTDAEIEEILKNENPELLRTYNRVTLQEEQKDTKKAGEKKKFSEANKDNIVEKDISEQRSQRQSKGYER